MAEMDPRVLAVLETVDLDQWTLELADYAIWMARRGAWRRGGGREGQLAEGKQIEDIVQEAFAKVLSRAHRWPEDHSDLLSYLKDVVKRLISNLSRSADNQTHEFPQNYDQGDDGTEDALSPAEEHVLTQLLELAEKRPDVQAIIEAFLEGRASHKDELSHATGMERKDIYNALRHIRRHITPPTSTTMTNKGNHG